MKIKNFIHSFRKIEKYSLVFFLSMMIFIAVLQIFLRFFLRSSVQWFDTVLRYIVLWVGMIAAGIATYEGTHIKIDLVGKFSKGRFKELVNFMIDFFAGVVSIILFAISLFFIFSIERESGGSSPFPAIRLFKSINDGITGYFIDFSVPNWFLLIIIPVTFFIIGVRFFIKSQISYYHYMKDVKMISLVALIIALIENTVLIIAVSLFFPIRLLKSIDDKFSWSGLQIVLIVIAIVISLLIIFELIITLIKKMDNISTINIINTIVLGSENLLLSVFSTIIITKILILFNNYQISDLSITNINLMMLIPVFFTVSSIMYFIRTTIGKMLEHNLVIHLFEGHGSEERQNENVIKE